MERDINNKQVLVANTLKRVLRPIVKLMLSNNLSYTFAIDLMKSLFVEVADEDFCIKGKRQTDSRISLISGVHRKDVRRLREHLPDVAEVVPDNIPLSAQLIALWNADSKYLGEDGLPKPIPRFAVSEFDDSFETMVRSVSRDIHPRAVLDEWLHNGIARLDEQKFVHLISEVFVPQEGFAEKIYYLGHSLHDHAQAAVSNVLSQQPCFLERCVHYDELSPSSIHDLSELAKKVGMKTLREINKEADSHAKQDANTSSEKMRMTYGIYYYAEPMQTTAPSSGEVK